MSVENGRRMIYISADCDSRLTEYLTKLGYEISCIRSEGIVAQPVSNHPDMFICRLGIAPDAEIILCPGRSEYPGGIHFCTEGSGRTVPGHEYPHDIAYNAACSGKFFIHNLKYTAPELLRAAEERNMQFINVKQGYAKCSTVVVDEESIITYDRGIAGACSRAGMNVLTVNPGYVVLPGYNCGFIGGASGRADDTVYFNGDLEVHPDCGDIVRFIGERGLKVKWFPEWPLTDIGSIL